MQLLVKLVQVHCTKKQVNFYIILMQLNADCDILAANSEYVASYNHTMQLGAIPVDLNDRCIMAEEIGDRHHNSMRPPKWKCTNECRLLTNRSCIGDKGTI